MSTKTKCKVCKKENCYAHCQVAVDGQHVADPASGRAADDYPFVIDFNCEKCGQSGSVKVDANDIAWE